jgi:hypothetical protein
MIQVQEFVAERAATIAGKVRKARKNSLASAREAARGSAESIKSLRNPVRVVSRSGSSPRRYPSRLAEPDRAAGRSS